MTEPIDFRILDRYLSGELDAHDAAALERRAAGDPSLRTLIDELRAGVTDATPFDVDAAWAHMQPRMSAPAATRVVRSRAWRGALAVAALLTIAAGIGVYHRLRTVDVQVSYALVQDYQMAIGERRTIDLPDGSQVVLAAATQLHVPSTFGDATREVILDGQAFFTVQPDSQRPFIVRAHGTQTRVLGTSFDVASYPGEAYELMVVSGRVEVSTPRQRHVVAAGYSAVADSAGNVTVSAQPNAGEYTGWRDGRFTFRDMTLADAAPRLERWFDIDVVIADDALAHTRFTAFLEHQQLDDVLAVIAATVGARFAHTGRTVRFYR